MIPVVTPAEMNAVDAAASEPVEVLIHRAAGAVARSAVRVLGGTYGRRVCVLAGPGNNGADGRVAALRLERLGVRCTVIDALAPPETIPPCDLLIDAAFGTGLTRPYAPPPVPSGTPVLAVDIPSGVDGLTGACLGEPLRADHTITFAALKPGLLFEPGRSLTGPVEVADIGLDVGHRSVQMVEDADVADLVSPRPVDDHKWRSGVRVVGGSPGMTGAVSLAARAAMRVGAGIVHVAMPGGDGALPLVEAVGIGLPASGWGEAALKDLDRVAALLVGPGLGTVPSGELAGLQGVELPIVLDGDALQPDVVQLAGARTAPTVITPHDGEWARLGGGDEADRISATRSFAADHGITVVRKGPTTVVADPHGEVRVITSGSAALASAGTGDVLAGAITALVARGLTPLDAVAVGAHVHGVAGCWRGPGLLAHEVADELATVLLELT